MFASLLTPLLAILSAQAATPIVPEHPEAQTAFSCDFEEGFDRNYDRWPDDWKRKRGGGYPFYLTIEIDEDHVGASPSRALKMELDGGAALAYSPPIPIQSAFSYVLRSRLRTEGLQHDFASCAITFLDESLAPLETVTSKPYQVDEWTEVEIGPITPSDPSARWAVIELHLQPTRQADLRGSAWFDDLWLGKLPRMSIIADRNAPFNVFTSGDQVSVTCHVSGFSLESKLLSFELLDVDGRVIATDNREIEVDTPKNSPNSRQGWRDPDSQQDELNLTGKASWKPRIPGNGFYRVRASLPGLAGTIIERSLQLVVVEPQGLPKQGEFGWSLSQGDDPLTIQQLEQLLKQVGIHWVKFPIWYQDQDQERADQLALFAERLNAHQMQLIGLLDQPPASIRELFGPRGQLPIASIFVDPDAWRPTIDPVMTRLSLKVRWWQLGDDSDTSFVNFPNLEEKIRGILSDLNRFGQEINLGISIRSIDQRPAVKDPPWEFLSYIAKPPLTARELEAYFLPEDQATTSARRWLILQPLSDRSYDLVTRATDLVRRMITAKQLGLDGIFVPNPFDPETGLMAEDGSPEELLLAWRTTALMTSGADHIGTISMPAGSTNHVFARGEEAIMVVWNDSPVEEAIYLGANVKQFDIWGREIPVREVEDGEFVRQVIRSGPLPSFITGVDPYIARWRMDFEFETKRLASVFGQQQTAWYRFSNSFDRGVMGDVRLITPIVPDPRSTDMKFKLAANEETRQPMHVTLGANLDSGEQPVRIDFQIGARRFSVYRTIHIGLGDVEFGLTSFLDDAGNLIVKQTLKNNTDNFVSFNCMLFAKNRRRQHRRVRNLPRGEITNQFTFPNGQELIGTSLTLRAEEIDGMRILNQHHVPEP